jgi:hypothetical protein
MAGRPKGGLKYGGRKKGTPNKTTATMREAIASFVDGKLGECDKIWAELKPREQAKFLTDLLPYVAPRLASTELKQEAEAIAPVTIKLGGQNVTFS